MTRDYLPPRKVLKTYKPNKLMIDFKTKKTYKKW